MNGVTPSILVRLVFIPCCCRWQHVYELHQIDTHLMQMNINTPVKLFLLKISVCKVCNCFKVVGIKLRKQTQIHILFYCDCSKINQDLLQQYLFLLETPAFLKLSDVLILEELKLNKCFCCSSPDDSHNSLSTVTTLLPWCLL